MVPKTFSTAWKSSTRPRKQRKYVYNAPLHIRQKLMRVHLVKELRSKYGVRSVQIHKGDKVRIMRGQFRKKEGKVGRVELKRRVVYISGIDTIKKDGTKILAPLQVSNLTVLELELGDKLRKEKLESFKAKKVYTPTEKQTTEKQITEKQTNKLTPKPK